MIFKFEATVIFNWTKTQISIENNICVFHWWQDLKRLAWFYRYVGHYLRKSERPEKPVLWLFGGSGWELVTEMSPWWKLLAVSVAGKIDFSVILKGISRFQFQVWRQLEISLDLCPLSSLRKSFNSVELPVAPPYLRFRFLSISALSWFSFIDFKNVKLS